MAPLARPRKTKFWTVYPMLYAMPLNDKFEYSYPLSYHLVDMPLEEYSLQKLISVSSESLLYTICNNLFKCLHVCCIYFYKKKSLTVSKEPSQLSTKNKCRQIR